MSDDIIFISTYHTLPFGILFARLLHSQHCLCRQFKIAICHRYKHICLLVPPTYDHSFTSVGYSKYFSLTTSEITRCNIIYRHIL